MARKRKGQALNDCPKDLDDIPYIRWMNQQIANGRHPKGLSAPPVLDGQGSTAQSPSAAMSREPRKKRSAAPVERGLWSDKESTIFAAAKWFMKEELEPLKGKQGTQYWVRLLAHIKESNPGWCRGVNALQKQWRNLTLLWREYKRGDGGSGLGSVEKPPWYPYLELHNQDTAAAAPHAVDGGGATDVNVPAGTEVPSSSQLGTSI
ncbi:unnamed protein product [Closterium sp. Naga37s-1]|nr:unnamed protein product [Closterium sp. Naga37s-1]